MKKKIVLSADAEKFLLDSSRSTVGVDIKAFARELGRLGAAKSPRSDAWREMDADELAAIGRKGATARWAKLSEAERKAQMDKVRAGRAKK